MTPLTARRGSSVLQGEARTALEDHGSHGVGIHRSGERGYKVMPHQVRRQSSMTDVSFLPPWTSKWAICVVAFEKSKG